ncbi:MULTISPECIES: hypothetical protein [Bordetella]|uniref:hypothetical protein n=1 Tax=Bordetella TaxID=517 RepID=UPI0002BBD0D4|nr:MULTISPECIES: hypothetical protein [Bordetella]AMD47379.1 hypothetical protein H558_15215 [Bordetella holmesii H558]AMD50490.1 hypothetical protein F783_002835 [Bordetella holmesii F627]AOB37313.1 hypothetical protein BBB42_08985 [Bordetella holmesii]KAK95469.1 hypothetical protein L499_A1159 [Bordetella holmesii CDC-H635-BH]PNO98349.1 hypothetical protein AL465_005325 [Bordetella pertussis 18323]
MAVSFNKGRIIAAGIRPRAASLGNSTESAIIIVAFAVKVVEVAFPAARHASLPSPRMIKNGSGAAATA